MIVRASELITGGVTPGSARECGERAATFFILRLSAESFRECYQCKMKYITLKVRRKQRPLD
jgi:hypothetical protein